MISKLDNFFEGKTKKDIVYIHIAALSLIGFIVFYFIYPISSSYQTREEQHYKNNVNRLNNLKKKKNNYLSQIMYLNRINKQLKLSKISLYKNSTFFDDLVSLLDFAKFDKYKWADYMKNIVYNSKEEGLSLIDFKNNVYNDNNDTINRKMDVIVFSNGKFKNFINYMYKYENTKELLRINELKVSDKGNYMIKFTLYGYDK